MSSGLMTGSMLALLILFFVFYCIVTCLQDVKFAFLNLFRHKRRSFSTVIAIVIGGVSVFLYGGFIEYSFWILQEQTVRTNIGHLQVYNESYFETSNKSKSLIVNYSSLKKEIEKNSELADYISTLSGQLEFTGVISQYENETSSYFSALGIEPLASLKLGSFDKLIAGSDLSRVKNNEIIMGRGLAKTLNTHYSDWLDMMVVNSQGGQGALSLKLRGIFESGIKDYDDVALKLPLATAQRIFDTNGVSKFVILLNNAEDLDLFRGKLEKFIADKKLPLIVKSWKEISIFYQQVEGLLSGIYFFIKLIVAVIVVFMIGNSMTMNVVERTREITTLRAIGLKPRHVSKLFLLEGIFIGTAGAIGSLAIGFIIASIINQHGIAMPPSPGQTSGYTAFIKTNSIHLIAITGFIPVITSSLASILPAIRAAKLNIADAFKFV